MSEHSLGMIVCPNCCQSTAGRCAAHASFMIDFAASGSQGEGVLLVPLVPLPDAAVSRAPTSPQHRIRCGLQAMARALLAADAWTPEAYKGYAAASYALDELPVTNAANPTGPTTIETQEKPYDR